MPIWCHGSQVQSTKNYIFQTLRDHCNAIINKYRPILIDWNKTIKNIKLQPSYHPNVQSKLLNHLERHYNQYKDQLNQTKIQLNDLWIKCRKINVKFKHHKKRKK